MQDAFTLIPGGINASIWFLMLLIFVLGFFVEWIEISYIAVPLFLPIFINANTDLVWLATLICVNLQTSFLTPPFGWSLFFLRGVAPAEVTTRDIYRGIVPFVVMQLMALVIVFVFPGLATWLPKAIGWKVPRRLTHIIRTCARRPPLACAGKPGSAKGPYYVDFRARTAASWGHAFVWYGKTSEPYPAGDTLAFT